MMASGLDHESLSSEKQRALSGSMLVGMEEETPAKRVKLHHELVTPASSQASLALSCCHLYGPTLSPTMISEQSPDSLATTPMMSHEGIRDLLLKEANYDCYGVKQTPKRTNYLSWDDYFMFLAFLSSKRSKDPHSPTGACIVNAEQRVIGIGYNGFPRGCSDDVLPWKNPLCCYCCCDKDNNDHPTSTPNHSCLHTPNPYMVHAEVNAILNKCSDTVAGARMYVPHFPCNECAKVICQSRIKEVIYVVDRDHDGDTYRASRILLEMAGVKTRQYTPTLPKIQLDLESLVDNTGDDQSDSTKSSSTNLSVSSHSSGDEDRERYRNLLLKEANLDPLETPPSKRTDYLSWDDYFTSVAFLTAKRSKDPNTQVGACIVNSDKCLIGLGYNGFPRGCSDDHLPWARSSSFSGNNSLATKYPYVCHAEVNAILNKCSANVQGATLYVALFPCNECAKLIIQAGIAEVVYISDKYHDSDACRASRILFQMAGVQLRQHVPKIKTVDIEIDLQDDVSTNETNK